MAKVAQQDAGRQLTAFFLRNGYVRRADPERRATESRKYKKGDEIRLVAESPAELKTIRKLLRTLGFKPGRPHTKSNQWRQPIYGRNEVARFLTLIDEQSQTPSPNA